METDNEKPNSGQQPEENKAKPELPEDVMKLLEKQWLIIAIQCQKNHVVFWFAGKVKITKRVPFKDVMEWVCPMIILRIHHCWAINLHHMVDERHGPKEWWVKLTIRETFSVSKPYHEIFLDNLNNIIKYKRIRNRNEKNRHKKMFSSKFDY